MLIRKPDYYKDSAGKIRWRITARNGKRTHSATEGFNTKRAAKENFALLVDAAMAAHPLIQTEDGPLYE